MHLLNFGVNVQPNPLLFLEIQQNTSTTYWNVTELHYHAPEDKKLWSFAEWIVTSKPGLFGLVGGYANPTGVALIVILTIMAICSLPFVRRSGRFEVKSRFMDLCHSDYIYSSGTQSALMYWVQFWGQFFGIQWKNDKSPRVRVSFVLGTYCVAL